MSINTDGAESMIQRIKELEKALIIGNYNAPPQINVNFGDLSLNLQLSILLKAFGKDAVAVALDEELQKL